MSLDGIEKFVPGRAAVLPGANAVGKAAPAAECHGCGAPLQMRAIECSWCKRPIGDSGDWGARIEVTTLDDVMPSYMPGWLPPRPLPPASRLVTEGGRHVTGVLTVGYGISDVNAERIRRAFELAHSRGGAVVLEPRRPLSFLARLVRAVWPR